MQAPADAARPEEDGGGGVRKGADQDQVESGAQVPTRDEEGQGDGHGEDVAGLTGQPGTSNPDLAGDGAMGEDAREVATCGDDNVRADGSLAGDDDGAASSTGWGDGRRTGGERNSNVNHNERRDVYGLDITSNRGDSRCKIFVGGIPWNYGELLALNHHSALSRSSLFRAYQTKLLLCPLLPPPPPSTLHHHPSFFPRDETTASL